MITLEAVLAIVSALVGAPALLALLIDVLKWAGLIPDGAAPKFSAAFNLLVLVAVAVILQFYPRIDVPGWDAKLLELVKFGALIFTYITQIVTTKQVHRFLTRTLKVAAFSHRLTYYANTPRR